MANPADPTGPSPFDTGEVMPRFVGLFCDCGKADCEADIGGDFMAGSRDEAFAALREYAAGQGWEITPSRDYAPGHRP